jgi:hypothetical protein
MAEMIIQVGDKQYPFDPDEVDNYEAMAIEARVGGTFAGWIDAIMAGSATALTGLIWLLQWRENPKIKFQDVRFKVGEVEVIEEGVPETGEDGTGDSDPVNPTPSEEVTPDEGTTT